MFVSGLGSWDVGLITSALDLSFGSWAFGPTSFLIRSYVCFWTWTLERWTCHSSIGLVFLKLGLRPSFILNKKWCVFLELDFGTSRLLLQHWTCYFEAGPFSFILKKKLCVFLDLEAGMFDLSSSIGLVFWKLGRRNYVRFWTWKLGRWTCHSSIGLVFLKLGLRPSFILNKKLCLFLDLEAGTLNLSLQHWTRLLGAGPAAQLHSW